MTRFKEGQIVRSIPNALRPRDWEDYGKLYKIYNIVNGNYGGIASLDGKILASQGVHYPARFEPLS